MSEGMKKIEEIVGAIAPVDAEDKDLIDIAAMLLAALIDKNGGRTLHATVQTDTYQYTLTMNREAL